MIKKILIVSILLVLGYLGYQKYSQEKVSPINEQGELSELGLYSNSRFEFKYPTKYALTENGDDVTITSVPIPIINKAQCEGLDDEQARAYCLNPTFKLSPNITIQFLTGDPTDLWENAKIGPDEEIRAISSQSSYRYNYMSGEFGGKGTYGLFLDNGLLLATYQHEDSEGGVNFDLMKSNEYQLDHNQQKELLEQILSSLTIKP